MAHSSDIVAYDYRADTYCPDCIADVVTADGGPYDGWALADGSDPMDTEDNLDEIALAFSIDRYDETTFDIGDFPKIVLLSMMTDSPDDHCGLCHERILP